MTKASASDINLGGEEKKKSLNKNSIMLVVLAVVTVAAIGFAYHFYTQAAELKTNPQKAAVEEAGQLVAKVGELIVLPEGEQPTIATVTDPEKLKNQPFFARAKKDDKVLIYTNARKAILYDPVLNKILEVAPLNIGNPLANP